MIENFYKHNLKKSKDSKRFELFIFVSNVVTKIIVVCIFIVIIIGLDYLFKWFASRYFL